MSVEPLTDAAPRRPPPWRAWTLLAVAALIAALAGLAAGRATDLPTYTAVIVLFFVIAALACWIPAWRASALDPTVALREE